MDPFKCGASVSQVIPTGFADPRREGFFRAAAFMNMRRTTMLLVSLLVACGSDNGRHGGGGGGNGGAGGNGGNGGAGGGNGGNTFSVMCNGTPTTITGAVMAPNGVDPIANAFAYVPASTGQFPAGVACDLCGSPIDGAAAQAISAPDGSFSIDLGNLAPTAQVPFTINKGRFRRQTMISITPCQENPIGAPHTVLPGKAGPGDDIPKIAVATGVKDALDVVLTAMGLDQNVGYDCFENQSKTTTMPLSPCETRLAAQGSSATQLTDLLKNESMLEQYNILFISCAYGKYSTIPAADQATIVANLQTWTGKGGRLFTTDRAYDYIAQAFPSNVTFMNGDATVDAANVGVGNVQTPATYTGKVNDPTLISWLTAVSALKNGQNTIPLTGYLTQWSVVQSVPMTTVDVVDATDAQVQSGTTMMTGVYPQTVKFDITPPGGTQACGRAVFSSYHTLGPTMMVDATNLTPQERILEYLMFEAGACVGTIN
jgi:hypothetical protein